MESETLKETMRKVRIQVPYAQQLKNLKMRPTFMKHWEKWAQVERLLITCMLYHSGSISDAAKYVELSDYQLRVPSQ